MSENPIPPFAQILVELTFCSITNEGYFHHSKDECYFLQNKLKTRTAVATSHTWWVFHKKISGKTNEKKYTSHEITEIEKVGLKSRRLVLILMVGDGS